MRTTLNCADIITKYLTDNGYDGLYCNECCCVIDNLFPCCTDITLCKAGHLLPCPGPGCDNFGVAHIHIGRKGNPSESS